MSTSGVAPTFPSIAVPTQKILDTEGALIASMRKYGMRPASNSARSQAESDLTAAATDVRPRPDPRVPACVQRVCPQVRCG